jgi:hypothetical protein
MWYGGVLGGWVCQVVCREGDRKAGLENIFLQALHSILVGDYVLNHLSYVTQLLACLCTGAQRQCGWTDWLGAVQCDGGRAGCAVLHASIHLKHCWNACIFATLAGHVQASTPHTVIEELFDCVGVDVAETVFAYIENNAAVWANVWTYAVWIFIYCLILANAQVFVLIVQPLLHCIT